MLAFWKNRSASAACLLLAVAFSVTAARAEPYLPASDETIVEKLPQAGNTAAQELRRLQAALNQSPNLLDLALIVAQKYVALGLSETDPRYDGRAEAALAPWINLADPPVQVRMIRAILRQRVHNFDAALRDLDAVLTEDPQSVQARLVRATVHQVRGEFPAALADCAALGSASDRLHIICEASVHVVTGSASDGIDALRQTISRGFTKAEIPTELWALTLIGETAARLGRAEEAETAFHSALGLGIRDPYLLGTYADFLLDQGRAQEVEALLEQETRVDPLLLRLALADQILHRPELDSHIADLSERFAAARQRGDTAHRREEARFTLELLGQPQLALKLALEDWGTQHEPADVRLLLETARAANATSDIDRVMDWIRKTGLEDKALTALAKPDHA